MTHTLTPTTPAADTQEVARLLTPEGERVSDARLDRWAADLDAEMLRTLYRDMAVTRWRSWPLSRYMVPGPSGCTSSVSRLVSVPEPSTTHTASTWC